eukprot:5803289-Karenia_brevis.AAC.1
MDSLLQEAWGPIFRMYENVPEPTWESFKSRFHAFIPHTPLQVSRITGHDIRKILNKLNATSVAGFDGWGVKELRLLPDCLLNCLADLLNVVETVGKWPEGLEHALVSLISKGSGAKPLDLRPISLMSIVYRIWAVRRLQDIKLWQESWATEGQHGFRPGHCTHDVFWSLAVKVEAAILEGKPLFGISFDYTKCFDCIPQGILLELIDHMGIAECILKPIRAMYSGLRKSFKINGG